MKVFNKILLPIVVILSITLGTISCQKDSYIKDGGVSNTNTSLSTYDYLKGNKYHYFDTTILLIDHFNLQDSVNNAGTFFAFTDYSVNTLMTSLNCTSLDQLYDSVSSKLITQYLFPDSSITLDNATLSAVEYPSWASDTVQTAVKKVQGSYGIYLNSSAPVFNYYTLQYISINGVLDGSPDAPADDPVDAVVSCQTSGIKTATGTTLHVLANNALLKKL